MNYTFYYTDGISRGREETVIFSDGRYLEVAETQSGFGKKTVVYHIHDNTPIAAIDMTDEAEITVVADKNFWEQMNHEYFVPHLLNLEIPLMRRDAFSLHSSFIEVNGKAILFSADSGGGKSTQAELWQTFMGARIINGDKNLVQKTAEGWRAVSSPFSGSSPYCLNETWPIAAIVILDKASENHLTRMQAEAFFPILKQSVAKPWDEAYAEKQMDLIPEMCEAVPIYHYACTKERDAADLLYRELFG